MALIIFSNQRSSTKTQQWLWRILAGILFGGGIATLIFTVAKGSHYGLFHAKNQFVAFEKTYALDGYSIIPLALEAAIILLELAGIIFLSRIHKLHSGRKAVVIPLKPAIQTTTSRSEHKTSTVISAQNIYKSYETTLSDEPVLKDITLDIRAKESIAIVGKSGSGKSTIMHILATLDRPTSGILKIDGTNASDLAIKDLDHLRNKKFGFVFQQFFVNGKNTCLENVILPLVIMGVSPEEREARGLAILEAVGLQENAKQRAGDLSGGQKQRLCIARALITQPEVIFADEPTGNLDSENGRRIIELLFKLQREQGITLVIVTHDNDLAKLCDRAITIRDGSIISITTK